MNRLQQPWAHDGHAMPAQEPAWVPLTVRGQEPYREYSVQQHQGPQAYTSAPRPMQHPQGRATHDSYVSAPGGRPESTQQGRAMGHPGEAPGLDRHLYASHQDEPWQAPAWQRPEGSVHPAYRTGQSFPEALADDSRYVRRRQHASMEAMHAGVLPRSAGDADRETMGLHSQYPPGQLSHSSHWLLLHTGIKQVRAGERIAGKKGHSSNPIRVQDQPQG